MPRTASFEDTESVISYDTAGDGEAALITYSYHGVPIGSIRVDFAIDENDTYLFDTLPESSDISREEQAEKTSFIFVNVLRILLALAGIAVILFLILLVKAFLKNYAFAERNNRRTWRRNRRQRRRKSKWSGSNHYRDYD